MLNNERETWYKNREHKPGVLHLYVMEYFVTKRIIDERKVGRDVTQLVEREVVQRPLYAANVDAAIVMMNQIYRQNKMGHMHKSLDAYPKGIEINGTSYKPTEDWIPPVFDE